MSGSNSLIIGLVVGIGGPLLILITVVIILLIARCKNNRNNDQAQHHGDSVSKKEESYDMIGSQPMNPDDRKTSERTSADDPYLNLNQVGSADQHEYESLPVALQGQPLKDEPYSNLQQTGLDELHKYECLPAKVVEQSSVNDQAYSALERTLDTMDSDHHNYELLRANPRK